MIRLVVALILLVPHLHAQDTRKPGADTHKPNIIYILADDLGYGDVSYQNKKAAWKTPAIDRLAAEGVAFTDAHSPSSVCTPTRYGILTGRYAWRTRLKSGVLGGRSPHLIDPARMTVATLLKKHGYHTACIGKWHLGWDFAVKKGDPKSIDYTAPVKNGPLANGFDTCFCHNGSLDMPPYVYLRDDRVTAPPNRSTENKSYQGFWRRGPTGSDFVHERVLPTFTREAINYIKQQAKTQPPFFLYLALPAPHTPILPTKAFRGKSNTNAYGDFVLQVDATVGSLLDTVDSAGIRDNTMIIFTSDNGCSPRARFEELAGFGHKPSGPFRGFKAGIYEGAHRVPFVVRWPQVATKEKQVKSTVCLTDFMRTCADILGTSLPDTAGEDSVSFLPTLLDSEAASRRVATVHHSINGSFAIRKGKWKLILCPGSGGWSIPRPAAAKKAGMPPLQLYDLSADPSESHNVADSHSQVIQQLRALLQSYVDRGRSTPGAPQPNSGVTRVEN